MAKQDLDTSNLDCLIATIKIKLNGLYGYSIVQQEKHSEIALLDLSNINEIKQCVNSLRFKSLLKVDNKVIINQQKKYYELSYPLFLGSAILWKSKEILATFIYKLYDYIELLNEKIGNENDKMKLDIQVSDTDSVIFSIQNFRKHFANKSIFTYKFNTEIYQAFDTTHNTKDYQQPETHQAFSMFKDSIS